MPATTLSRVLWIAAVIPPLILLIYIYLQDRLEKEPPKLLALLFFGGALSVLSATLLELAGFSLARWLFPSNTVARAAFLCFFIVGAAEEVGKYLFLHLFSWRNSAFNYRFDGIVYAVFVSMGFALVENIIYVAADHSIETALLRCATAIPGHAAFAVFMGFYYGTAKLYSDAAGRCHDERRAFECQRLSRRFLRRAVWVPVLLHGFYDFCLELDHPWMRAVFIVFVVALYLVAVRQIQSARRRDVPV